MLTSTTVFSLIALLGLTSATPTPVELAPRCGTTNYPSSIQRLSQSSPDTSYSSSSNFRISQTLNADKNYEVLTFSNIPAGSYACQLNVKFPGNAAITTSGTGALDVRTLYKDVSAPPSNTWTWNSVAGAFGQGVFGSTTLNPGQVAAIGSNSCPSGGGSLSFVVQPASWVSGTSSVEYTQSDPTTGFYLTYNC